MQTSLILIKHPPKPYKRYFFYQFSDNCKIPSCTYNLKEAAMKIAMFAHFKEYHGNHKNLKSLYGFGGRCIKIKDACMDFEPCFKVYNLVSVHTKSTILGQMTNPNPNPNLRMLITVALPTELQGQNGSRPWVCEMLFVSKNSARPKPNLDNR